MGTDYSKQSEMTGQANNNVVIEQKEEGMDKVDLLHSTILVLLLVMLIMQSTYVLVRQYQRRLKRKYIERLAARMPKV